MHCTPITSPTSTDKKDIVRQWKQIKQYIYYRDKPEVGLNDDYDDDDVMSMNLSSLRSSKATNNLDLTENFVLPCKLCRM